MGSWLLGDRQPPLITVGRCVLGQVGIELVTTMEIKDIMTKANKMTGIVCPISTLAGKDMSGVM
jgi:hypothetical protein